MNTRWALGGAATTAACALAAGALSLRDAQIYPRLGLPVPDAPQRMLVAALRTVIDLGGAVTLGSLLFAVVVVRPRPRGELDVEGYLATRRAGWAAAVAAAAALALVPVLVADQSGTTVSAVVGGDLWTLAVTLREPVAWGLCAVGLSAVAIGGRLALTWRGSAALLLLSVVSLVAPGVVGQAENGAGHDWATDAALVQAPATATAIGLPVAVLAWLCSGRGSDDKIRRRAATALAGTWLATLGSGIVLTGLWGSWGSGTYWDEVADTRLILLLVSGLVCAWQWRRRPAWAAAIALLGATGAGVLQVVLWRWVPPAFLHRPETIGESLVGYDLPDPVTAARLLLDWRFNLLFGTAAAILATAYLLGVARLRARGDAWSGRRTAAWLTGCAVLMAATCSGVGRYSPALFSIHMISHMTLNMLVPVLLVLGGPVTLALRALPPAGRGNPPGVRELIVAATGSPIARRVTHPLPMMALFVGSFYVLYLTRLFDIALRYHWAHQLMNLHFLLVGYLFFWPLIGADPAPSRLPHLGRLAVVLATMPFHAFFGITVMSTHTVLGGDFYGLLGLRWVGELLGDQHVGGGIAWASGELPMLLVILALAHRWSRDDAREAARHDRHPDGEADLAAYNAMLARMAGSERP
jgi:putative copper resistance protein D